MLQNLMPIYKTSGTLIYRNGVIGVTFSQVVRVVARIGLQALAIEHVVKGLPVLNAFCQVWVCDPAQPVADGVDLARCYELLALFGEDPGIEEQFGVFNVRTVSLENVVLCPTFYT